MSFASRRRRIPERHECRELRARSLIIYCAKRIAREMANAIATVLKLSYTAPNVNFPSSCCLKSRTLCRGSLVCAVIFPAQWRMDHQAGVPISTCSADI